MYYRKSFNTIYVNIMVIYPARFLRKCVQTLIQANIVAFTGAIVDVKGPDLHFIRSIRRTINLSRIDISMKLGNLSNRLNRFMLVDMKQIIATTECPCLPESRAKKLRL